MVESENLTFKRVQLCCNVCEKKELLLPWMPCDMWNKVAREFRRKHENCEKVK